MLNIFKLEVKTGLIASFCRMLLEKL